MGGDYKYYIATTSAAVAAAAASILGYYYNPIVPPYIESSLLQAAATNLGRLSYLPSLLLNRTRDPPDHPPPFTCLPHAYATTLISVDPLVIYIQNFTTPAESAAIIASGAPRLEASPVTGYGATDAGGHRARTSRSAPLRAADGPVACVLSRAEALMGTVLSPGRDDMGTPQMVRYTAGQKFDLHTDWFARPRILDGDSASGRRRLYNRVATVFAVLECRNCTDGETWFPRLKPTAPQHHPRWRASGREANEGEDKRGDERVGEVPFWREHQDGGLAFRPIAGNAVFWVNLLPNGTGDARVIHAGLPVGEGSRKTAMNIWPRTFFGPDA